MEESTRELTAIPAPRRIPTAQTIASIIQKSEFEEELPAEDVCAMT
jgi:hypothetical protein